MDFTSVVVITTERFDELIVTHSIIYNVELQASVEGVSPPIIFMNSRYYRTRIKYMDASRILPDPQPKR